MAEEDLIQIRQAKADALRQAGQNPFATGQQVDSLESVRSQCEAGLVQGDRYDPVWLENNSQTFSVAGRIIFFRKMGGAAFIRLRDRTGELQLYCEEKVLGERYAFLEQLDMGDIIWAEGPAMATIKGELSLRTNKIEILTKSYRPLPTKTAFKDVESRYRQRYVDLIANREVTEIFKLRSKIISGIREYFQKLDFVEVETPTMQLIPGGASARPFITHHNTLDLDLYLRIAPELYLKRLVVGGFERVFEIGRNYRNEGISTRHNPEFTMLEYYWAYSNLNDIMSCTQDLLGQLDRLIPENYQQQRPFSLSAWSVVTMTQAVSEALKQASLPDSVIEQIASEQPEIKLWSKSASRKIDWSGYRTAALKTSSSGERLALAFEFLAEPFLTLDYTYEGKSRPVFITEYPVEISPLARQQDKNPKLTDRFELFIHGRELANAFQELSDPREQALRFQEQAQQKAQGNEEAMFFDQDYIRALEYGLPPVCGMGMGIDRLVMALLNQQSIRDVILFPLMR